MARLPHNHLLIISKGSAQSLNNFRLGVHITQTSGLGIDELLENAVKDRFRFASETLRNARWALTGAKPRHRVGLARAYYAMYHATRAVVFFCEKGDDHEAHSELPKHLPRDFPDRARWENDIKIARLERNRADYDPYPKSDAAF
jgi:uncharacterized protein (UPF0332 family)